MEPMTRFGVLFCTSTRATIRRRDTSHFTPGVMVTTSLELLRAMPDMAMPVPLAASLSAECPSSRVMPASLFSSSSCDSPGDGSSKASLATKTKRWRAFRSLTGAFNVKL